MKGCFRAYEKAYSGFFVLRRNRVAVGADSLIKVALARPKACVVSMAFQPSVSGRLERLGQ